MTRWTNTGFVAWVYPGDIENLKKFGSMTIFESKNFACKSTPFRVKPVRIRIVLERARPNAKQRLRKSLERMRAKSKRRLPPRRDQDAV